MLLFQWTWVWFSSSIWVSIKEPGTHFWPQQATAGICVYRCMCVKTYTHTQITIILKIFLKGEMMFGKGSSDYSDLHSHSVEALNRFRPLQLLGFCVVASGNIYIWVFEFWKKVWLPMPKCWTYTNNIKVVMQIIYATINYRSLLSGLTNLWFIIFFMLCIRHKISYII